MLNFDLSQYRANLLPLLLAILLWGIATELSYAVGFGDIISCCCGLILLALFTAYAYKNVSKNYRHMALPSFGLFSCLTLLAITIKLRMVAGGFLPVIFSILTICSMVLVLIRLSTTPK